jgi:hypothetical protein
VITPLDHFIVVEDHADKDIPDFLTFNRYRHDDIVEPLILLLAFLSEAGGNHEIFFPYLFLRELLCGPDFLRVGAGDNLSAVTHDRNLFNTLFLEHVNVTLQTLPAVTPESKLFNADLDGFGDIFNVVGDLVHQYLFRPGIDNCEGAYGNKEEEKKYEEKLGLEGKAPKNLF